MYIGAFMLTWIFNALSSLLNVSSIELDAINCVLFPLQGFWNLLIFLYDKTYLIRQHDKNDNDVSFWMAFKQILTSPFDAPTIELSSISIVKIESRDEDAPDEPNDSPLSFRLTDIGLSQIDSLFDGLSELIEKDGAFSLMQGSSSSSINVNSDAVSEIGKQSSLEAAPRTNLLNVRGRIQNHKNGEYWKS
jgi:hypothetical protein